MHTAARAIIANDPQLRVQIERFLNIVDVLCSAVFEMLQRVDFLRKVRNGFVLLCIIEFVVEVINVDDFDRNDFLRSLPIARRVSVAV